LVTPQTELFQLVGKRSVQLGAPGRHRVTGLTMSGLD
jgi:hypothetical protein